MTTGVPVGSTPPPPSFGSQSMKGRALTVPPVKLVTGVQRSSTLLPVMVERTEPAGHSCPLLMSTVVLLYSAVKFFGLPVAKLVVPETCQPPNALRTKPFSARRKSGTSQM